MKPVLILFSLFISSLAISQLYETEENFLKGDYTDSEEVTSMYLYEQNLTEIPDAFNKYTNLTFINLDENQLTQLPPSLFRLKHLDYLSAYDNQIQGTIEFKTDMDSLNFLDLSNNQIKSIQGTQHLKNLEYFFLHDNQLTEIPEFLHHQNLKNLMVSKNKLKSIPESICNYKNLESLHLSDNQLNDLPDCVENLKSIENIDIANNAFTEFPTEILALTNLTSLDVSHPAQFEIPNEIRNLKKLEYFYLDKEYYAKNQKKIKDLLPKNCKINTPPPPPPPPEPPQLIAPSISEIPVLEDEETKCFTYLEKSEKNGRVYYKNHLLEFGWNGDNARIVITEYDYEKEVAEKIDKGEDVIATTETLQFIEGSYTIENEKLIFIPEKEKFSDYKKDFIINYSDNSKKSIKELKDKKNSWKKGDCLEKVPSIGF